MREYIETIRRSPLFYGMTDNEILLIINKSGGYIKNFKKNEYILRAGEYVDKAGIVLKGNICIQKEDYWGNIQILTQIAPCQMFGETYSLLPNIPSGAYAYSKSDSIILFMKISNLSGIAANNLIKVLAGKNLTLTEKLEHMSGRTTRDKILSFLSSYSKKSQTASFRIPYTRQQMADYLSVDRSALSRELSRLKHEKIIDFNKNTFTLL